MKSITSRWPAMALALGSLSAHAQSELQTYVQRCQDELQFTASQIPPLNCSTHGVNYANFTPTPVNDFLIYHRVNDNVDLTANCRWKDFHFLPPGVQPKFASLEMFIHNRQTGGTCFFSARDDGVDPLRNVSGDMVSITNFSNIHPDADDYWLQPSELEAKLMPTQGEDDNQDGPPDAMQSIRCVGCHAGGPYIASWQIAPHLARYGLLNNGHDTFVNMDAPNSYHAVGSNHYLWPNNGSHPFKAWNSIIHANNYYGPDSCSGACHTVAWNSTMGTVSMPNDSTTLLSSIQRVIWYLTGQDKMAPDLSNEIDPSPYRWINRDHPGGDGVDIETFTASKPKFGVLGSCGNPTQLESHAVGSYVDFSTNMMSVIVDKLRFFNLREGLQCVNSDQAAGQSCKDYRVSYRCPGPNDNWTPFYNKDAIANNGGDYEEKSRAIVEATAFCGGAAPVGIRTQIFASGVPIAIVNGPNDRLAQFSPSGLICRDADQPNGAKCSSYVVRYRSCQASSVAKLARVKNAWVNPPTFNDRFLTTTNNVNGAETRAQAGNFQYPSQDWVIEPVSGGNTSRLRDIWSGKYLTASGNNDQAMVLVNDSNTTLMRQQWVIEGIPNSTEVRLRNVGSNRYLTVGNYTGDPYYAPMLSQSLSNQNWASQRWLIN